MSLFRSEGIGRLTKDPEIRTVNVRGEEQKVANFTVAIDHDFGDGTDFVDVVAWRQLAGTVEKFLGKGRLVYVEGRMQKRSYKAKTQGGEEYNRDVWELIANKVQFLDKPAQSGETTPYIPQEKPAVPSHSGPAPF